MREFVRVLFGNANGVRSEVVMTEEETRALRDYLNKQLGEYSAPLSPAAMAAQASAKR